ncbi:hypothetical protein BGW41_000332 [Actinomortierella wolfii]|nr:hypothetical protein BGW41_000332 [Actinomortierella wolfii]
MEPRVRGSGPNGHSSSNDPRQGHGALAARLLHAPSSFPSLHHAPLGYFPGTPEPDLDPHLTNIYDTMTQPTFEDQNDSAPPEPWNTKAPPSMASMGAGTPDMLPGTSSLPHHSRNLRPGPYSSSFSTASAAAGGTTPIPGKLGMDHQHQHSSTYNNPYRAPCVTNSNAFIPPKVPGYDFQSGSQAGYMGLMLGKRLSDGVEVTGKLHLSKVLLQHEYRIQTRLQIIDNQYDYRAVKDMYDRASTACPTSPMQESPAQTSATASATDSASTVQDPCVSQDEPKSMPAADAEDTAGSNSANPHGDLPGPSNQRGCGQKTPKLHKYEPGLIEGEKFFNRIVEGFVDLDQEDVSVLLMRQLGYNLLSHQQARFRGLGESPEFAPPVNAPSSTVSPFPDIYSFLIFCLKAAGLLEALQRHNLAHLAICPISLHWTPGPEGIPALLRQTTGPLKDSTTLKQSANLQHGDSWNRGIQEGKSVYALSREHAAYDNRPFGPQWKRVPTTNSQPVPVPFLHKDGTFGQQPVPPPPPPPRRYVTYEVVDVEEHIRQLNATKLRLFDFTHSKILSHERARAPNNIIEWQVPGFMEYHLQFIAPEQTGRAETWMDHRTDIYSMGATLFSLLTMQFPNRGVDSVQVLQGILSQELPPLSEFRPDMPPIIDSILRKMTQKQPINRYQTAFGFKQDILRCLNMLTRTGKIEQFPLGTHDVSYLFVLPNGVFGRQAEQQMISAAIAQAALAYQQSQNHHNCEQASTEDVELAAMRATASANDSDHYAFEDDIVSLQSQGATKIPLSSKTLLRTPKSLDGIKLVHPGSATVDPVVRAIFVSGPAGVGKTLLIRGMASVARQSGLFASGLCEPGCVTPYSAILSCIQNVLQQLLTQHTSALASLVIAIRTAFEPDSGIGIICDLIPELKYFFNGSEMPESKDVSQTHSVARFHGLILRLIRVISTHFFMTWLIDDIHNADSNTIALLSTLVNVNKRLPIILILTHRDTVESLMNVKQILRGNHGMSASNTGGVGGSSTMGNGGASSRSSSHSMSSESYSGESYRPTALIDPLVEEYMTGHEYYEATAARGASFPGGGMRSGDPSPVMIRGGGGVRFIRLQNPQIETVQEFLASLLHRNPEEVLPLARVLHQKSWLAIRQLVLELYRKGIIFYDCHLRQWAWEPEEDRLAETVRRLTGEEYAFIENRFQQLDSDTKKILVCASICGPMVTIDELQQLVKASYSWTGINVSQQTQEQQTQEPHSQQPRQDQEHPSDIPERQPVAEQVPELVNEGCNAMAGLQSAIREGILGYTTQPDTVRFHHNVMRQVAKNLLKRKADVQRLHYELVRILLKREGQEFKAASHVLVALPLIKKIIAKQEGAFVAEEGGDEGQSHYQEMAQTHVQSELAPLNVQHLRKILSMAGEKFQKSGAHDMAIEYWNAAVSLLPDNCWDVPLDTGLQRSSGSGPDNRTSMVTEQLSGDEDITMEPVVDDHLNHHDDIVMSDDGLALYNEALHLHLQRIAAERWREKFAEAMKICEYVLSKISDPVDRAKILQHQMEIWVWAYGKVDRATETAIHCLKELGVRDDLNFSPSQEEIRSIYDEASDVLQKHLDSLRADPPKHCTNPRIQMILQVLMRSTSSLYFQNVPFLAAANAEAVKLVCEHGVSSEAGRTLAAFALTRAAWHGQLDNAYEIGRIAVKMAPDNYHVKFLFYLTVQQWGEHVADSIGGLEESLAAPDVVSDRLFHTAGVIHVAMMRIWLGRVHLRTCMSSATDLLSKHVEFGPKAHGTDVLQGILQLLKCLKGSTANIANPETMFDDADFSEAKVFGKNKVNLTHNNSTYLMIKLFGAYMYGHFDYVDAVSDAWYDDPLSLLNFEGAWISHSFFGYVALSLVSLIRKESADTEKKSRLRNRLENLRARMAARARQSEVNHGAMYCLLEAEITDLDKDEEGHDRHADIFKAMALYEKAIDLATLHDFPLYKWTACEFAGNAYLRLGLISAGTGLLLSACKGYRSWGAYGKVAQLHRLHPALLMATDDMEFNPAPSVAPRSLFHRSSDTHTRSGAIRRTTPSSAYLQHHHHHHHHHHLQQQHQQSGLQTVAISSGTSALTSALHPSTTPPWPNAGSPLSLYSPVGMSSDAVATAVAIAGNSFTPSPSTSSNHSVPASFPPSTSSGAPSALPTTATTPTSGSSNQVGGSGPAVSCPVLQSTVAWVGTPQSPEIENADLDVLDFSSVIEAMQVIASEIDLDLLLVKSLGVLNQSVGARRCYVIMAKENNTYVLAASQGDRGVCEAVNPPVEVDKCPDLFHSVINYVINTLTPCLLANAADDPRFSADEYLKQHTDLRTVLCAPILHKAVMVGVLYMEDFPERAFANKRMLVMNLLVQQLGISITNALLYQSVLQSETKLNGLLENLPCGIALWDATATQCQYINSSWKDMTGFTLEEILESNWSVLTHPDEVMLYAEHWRQRVQAGVACHWESRYRLADGSFRWGIVRMLPIYSPTDPSKILQWLTVTVDIDDQRRAVQLKSNFLANMSHELRTPFSGILGMLSLLRDSSGLSQEQFEFVDMAKASCEMLIRIVDDLLNFSKLEADKVTLEYIPLCFEEILGDVCDLLVPLASRKGLELIILSDQTIPLILIGDPDRIKQILMNLIGNAIKFSTSGNVVVEFWHEMKGKNSKEEFMARQRKAISAGGDDQALQNDTVASSENTSIESTTTTTSLAAGGTSTTTSKNVGSVRAPMASTRTRYRPACRKSAKRPQHGPNGEPLGDEVILHCAVRDQGIGLSADEQQMLFVSFQQTDNGTTRKYGGTGLGLSICAQLIAHMDGVITVDSIKGHGSTFTFSIKLRTMVEHERVANPIESARLYECEKTIEIRHAALKDSRVLILSPNLDLRKQIALTLERQHCVGYDSVAAAVQANAIRVRPSAKDDIEMSDDAAADTSTASASQENESSVDIEPFDFILVDHVLDSAELDLLYPNPNIAYVLLLAPTTEQLRWILPPAEKRASDEEDDDDSSQIDIGGRGRLQAGYHPGNHALGSGHPLPPGSSVMSKTPSTSSSPSMGAPLNDFQIPADKIRPFDDVSTGSVKRASGYPPSLLGLPQLSMTAGASDGSVGSMADSSSAEPMSPSASGPTAGSGGSRPSGRGRGSISSSCGGSESGETHVAKLSIPEYAQTRPGCGVMATNSTHSQLFKRRKRSVGSVSPVASGGGRTKGATAGNMSNTESPVVGDNNSTITTSDAPYQVCRLIKPVRRLKLLQILYNAVMHRRGQGLIGSDGRLHHGGTSYSSSTGSGRESPSTNVSSGRSSPMPVLEALARSVQPLDTYSASNSATSPAVAVPQKRGREVSEPGATDGGNVDEERQLSSVTTEQQHAVAGAVPVTTRRESPAAQAVKRRCPQLKQPGAEGGAGTSVPSGGSSSVRSIRSHVSATKRTRNDETLLEVLTEEEKARCRGKNVLVAEDDFVSQKILEKQLAKVGMNVMITNNGKEAIQQWLAAERGYYTIAIFDHHMPIMDGLAATKKIREIEHTLAEQEAAEGKTTSNIRIPIVGLSADVQQSTKESCIKAGMDEYLTKPLLTKGLAMLIQKYCCKT